MRFSITSFLDSLSVKYKPNHKGSHLILKECPECKKSNKFYIHKSNGSFLCHYCANNNTSDMKGGVVQLVSKLAGISFEDAYKKVFNKTLTAEERRKTEDDAFLFSGAKTDDEQDNELAVVKIPSKFVPIDKEKHPTAYNYLLNERKMSDLDIKSLQPLILECRNFDEALESFKKDGYPEKECYFLTGYLGRVIFPVKRNGRTYGYMGRDYCGIHGKQKVLNSYGSFRSQIIWNLDNVKGQPVVVICEGIFNAIMYGLTCGVATFGKFITQDQFLELFKLDKKTTIVLCPDVDAFAYAEENKKVLECHFEKVHIIELPKTLGPNGKDYLDSNDYSKEQNQTFLMKAINTGSKSNLSDFDFINQKSKENLKNSSKKSHFKKYTNRKKASDDD